MCVCFRSSFLIYSHILSFLHSLNSRSCFFSYSLSLSIFADFVEDVDFNSAWIMSEWFTKYSCVFNKRQSGIKNHLMLLFSLVCIFFTVCSSVDSPCLFSCCGLPFLLSRMADAVPWLSIFKWFWWLRMFRIFIILDTNDGYNRVHSSAITWST